MYDYQRIIDKYYPAGSPLRDIYMSHCRSVASLALALADSNGLTLDRGEIEAAAMLHDIGIFMTDADGIHCHGDAPYLTHGVLGADLLRRDGAPEEIARVAERHTGAGLTAADVKTLNALLASRGATPGQLLPEGRTCLPESELEKLICYADKFYSKSGDMKRKPLDRVRASMAKFGPDSLNRFEELAHTFGIPAEE